MQIISNRKRIVESTYSPEDTNVLWVDLSEDKERKVKSIKEYKNGKWEEIIDSNNSEGSSELDYNNPEDIIKSNIVLIKNTMANVYFPSLGNPEELNFIKIKLFCKPEVTGNEAILQDVYLDKSTFDKLYLPSVSICILPSSVYSYNKLNNDIHFDSEYYTTITPIPVNKQNIVTTKDDSYIEFIVLACLLNSGSYENLPDWFIEKYKAN